MLSVVLHFALSFTSLRAISVRVSQTCFFVKHTCSLLHGHSTDIVVTLKYLGFHLDV